MKLTQESIKRRAFLAASNATMELFDLGDKVIANKLQTIKAKACRVVVQHHMERLLAEIGALEENEESIDRQHEDRIREIVESCEKTLADNKRPLRTGI